MTTFAYIYTDPLIEETPQEIDWGRQVERVYADIGGRSQLELLFQDCRKTPPQCLLVRRLLELGDTIAQVSDRLSELAAMGITLIATEQSYNSQENTPNLQAELLKLLQEIQTQHHSRRIRQAHARNRLEIAPPPGKPPYGYRRSRSKYIIDRSTAPVVKDFFDNFLLYGSLRGAVRYLNKKYGKNISVTTGKRWLTNHVYRGDTAYHHGEIISDTHTAIISREEAAQVDRLLRRNRRLPPRTASAPRSLAGLVVCQQCQSRMQVVLVTIRRQNKQYLYLRSLSCPLRPKCKAIAYQEVLEQTITSVCRDLPVAVEKMISPELGSVKENFTMVIELRSAEAAIAHQEEILTQLPHLVETGILDVETAKIRAYKLRTEISRLQAQIATLPPVNLISVAQAVSIPQFWLDLSEVERRFYFREFIRQIEIIRHPPTWELSIIFIF
ncbi:recombinase family protein [Calothrix sp. 336/3]|uniref:recombinase family protein n=1 Tax=Calothrix sp. 336/3 TaxID=1337936 RepID=UPI00062450D1|nr:recombinase family protein [Calothrix sp. 336/3]AKG20831.1 recombinase [Calothrix sp. 336/3]